MTARLRKLIEDRDRTWGTMSEIIARSTPGNPLTAADRAQYDREEARFDQLVGDIKREERHIAEERAEADASPAIGPDFAGTRSTSDTIAANKPLTRSQSFVHYVHTRGLVGATEREQPLDFGKYIRGMVTGEWEGADAERRAMSEGTPTAGGNLVPTMLSAQIIDLARAKSAVMGAGGVLVPMETNKVDVAKWTGDPTAAWRNENASVGTSDPTLSKVTLTAQSLAALVVASRELLEDAPNVQTKLMQAFAAAFALKVDLAALRGTGTAPEPRGIKNTSGITTTALGSGAGASPTWDDIVNAAGVLTDANESPSGVIWHPRTARALGKLKDSTGQYLRPPTVVDGLARGETTQIPINMTVGASTDCSEVYVGDFTQVYVGVRTNLLILPLTERYSDTGQIGFLAWWRGDVAIARPAAFDVLTAVRG